VFLPFEPLLWLFFVMNFAPPPQIGSHELFAGG
jgi:hypothetical protein